MDPRMLTYYNRELQHLREMGGEFAERFPKIAGRLALEEFECADPYVERLLEGLAFLAARVQLKLDAQFPEFAQHLFEIVYPHYLSPTPSMGVVAFEPELNDGALTKGPLVPRGTVLLSQIGKGEQTACRYRTAHDVRLWPLQIKQVEYYSRDEAVRGAPDVLGTRSGLRIRLAATAGLTFDKIPLERLPIFLQGPGELTTGLYEHVLGNTMAVVVRPVGPAAGAQETTIDAREIRRVGFSDGEALLPYSARSFQGYRLLHEYFAMPERFLFVELGGLAPALRRSPVKEIEIFLLFNRLNRSLEHRIDATLFSLFASPIVNLFPKRADRIQVDNRQAEFQVIPDRTRLLDYEVYSIEDVTGYGREDRQQPFLPFYAALDRAVPDRAVPDRADAARPDRYGSSVGYYTVRRVHRTLSEKQRRLGPRTSYVGSDLYISLVDVNEAPYSHELRQLGLGLLCTNRDMPLLMPLGVGPSDFYPELSCPLRATRCIVGPTRPRAALSYGSGDAAWRLVNHLSLNYASLVNDPNRGGAAALREMLSLYADMAEPHIRKQIEGLQSVVARPITRPVPTEGPLTFARGQQIAVTCDESAFEGTGVFLLGAVLEDFFARYVSINSFTETIVRTVERGEIMQWPNRIGRRQSL
jgi:type VI secretion system protein ImpG